MSRFSVWRRIPGKVLLVLLNVVSATALIFEGSIGALVSFHLGDR